jgi:hypothetical protein
MQQVFTTTPAAPPPYDTPLDKLMNFLEAIPEMLTSRTTIVQLIADFLINREKSIISGLTRSMFEKVAKLPQLSSRISASIERRLVARSATGAIKGRFKFMSLL